MCQSRGMITMYIKYEKKSVTNKDEKLFRTTEYVEFGCLVIICAPLIFLMGYIIMIPIIVILGIDLEDTTLVGTFGFIGAGIFTISSIYLVFYFLRRKKLRMRRIRNRREQRIRESGIQEIDMMNGIEFETYLTELYRGLGYIVTETKKSGDFGADLIIESGDQIVVIQAKRYKANVGVRAVQEVIAALSYYGADKGRVVTNSYFTSNAIELAKRSDIELIDRDILITKILKLKESNTS